jgi:hypothetical protein
MNRFKYILILFFSFSMKTNAQQAPAIKINNDTIYVNSDISFPYWLKEGQTLQPIFNIKTLSILEFNVDSIGNMIFSKVVALSQGQTIAVPTGKVWKMEAIGLKTAYSNSSNSQQINDTSLQSMSGFSNQEVPTANSPKKFLYAGTYNWVVPPNVTRICVEVWGAGGGGSGGPGQNQTVGGAGGGGGYGYQCFNVIPMSLYTITVGAGGLPYGDGGASNFDNLISASGGKKGTDANSQQSGLGGNGGTSTALYNYTGYKGNNGINNSLATKGGNSGDNTGFGGFTGGNASNKDGLPPGGGGSGSVLGGTQYVGYGADGRVIIYW